jgi:hypothetical protein
MEVIMDSHINIKKLRRDLMNYYGAALFAGFDTAMDDLQAIDKESEGELLKRAVKVGMDLKQYIDMHASR